MIFYSSDLLAQLDSIQYNLKFGNKTYASGDYASSMVAYEKALNYTLELDTQVNAKDSLFLISLKQLITVSGLGEAFEMSEGYFNQFKTKIYKNICDSEYKALKIGLINNYIGIAVYNKKNKVAINAFEFFIDAVDNCNNFDNYDLVQCSANAAMAYSDLKQTSKAYNILPLLKYYKDSVSNWHSADYNKVLAYVNANANVSPEVIIGYYKNSAKMYAKNKRFAYALDIYETLISDYNKHLSNEELINLIEKSNTVRDSTNFYHSNLYKKMMGQLSNVMLDRSIANARNIRLKNRALYLGFAFTVVIILFLLFVIKRQKDAKVHYRKLYVLEKQFEKQNKKLHLLKENFIKVNYKSTLASKTREPDIFEALYNDFPELRLNIVERFVNLTDKEIQIINCVLLNLSTKESADTLSLTNGAFRVSKNRLIKKTGFKSSDEFQSAIMQLL
tara:strand:- start:2391 stop:3731 length:1341 start_codon:yes stop_codon:yes gene_type:complete